MAGRDEAGKEPGLEDVQRVDLDHGPIPVA